MIVERSLDNILDSKSKIAIIRLFVSKTADFKATGREIAKLIRFSPPAAHFALKELYSQGILKLDSIGRQHIYSFDQNNRIVRKILKPMFKEEISFKDEVNNFLLKQVRKTRDIKSEIVSLLLYGSIQRNTTHEGSDVDIAVIVENKGDKKKIEEEFLNNIAVKFYDYFKVHLDVYVKTKDEFRARLKKNLPPLSTLMKSYYVIYGKEPWEI